MKKAPEKPPCQQIYLSLDGSVRESCGSIFSNSEFAGKNLFEVSPFVESCKNVFLEQRAEAMNEFSMPAVHLEFDSWSGIFDLVFLKIWLDDEEVIFGFVVEKTRAYRQKQARQQRRNEWMMAGGNPVFFKN